VWGQQAAFDMSQQAAVYLYVIGCPGHRIQLTVSHCAHTPYRHAWGRHRPLHGTVAFGAV